MSSNDYSSHPAVTSFFIPSVKSRLRFTKCVLHFADLRMMSMDCVFPVKTRSLLNACPHSHGFLTALNVRKHLSVNQTLPAAAFGLRWPKCFQRAASNEDSFLSSNPCRRIARREGFL